MGVCVCVRGCASCIDVTLFYYYYTLRKEYTQREPITKHLAHLLTHHLDLLCIANVIPLSLSLILSLPLSLSLVCVCEDVCLIIEPMVLAHVSLQFLHVETLHSLSLSLSILSS